MEFSKKSLVSLNMHAFAFCANLISWCAISFFFSWLLKVESWKFIFVYFFDFFFNKAMGMSIMELFKKAPKIYKQMYYDNYWHANITELINLSGELEVEPPYERMTSLRDGL